MTSKRRRGSRLEIIACATLMLSIAVAGYGQRGGDSPNDALVSPSVAGDGRVTFGIYAPEASQVTVTGDWMLVREPVVLSRDADGIWSAAVGPLAPDFYSYTLMVDGVRTLDPKNPMIKQGNTSVDNMFLLPGNAVAYADRQPVPHGDIRQVWYESSTLGTERRMHIYTPPLYDRSDTDYPVLYLLHGGGDEDSGWSTIGRAGFIIDNLLAAGSATPMLVVMPNGSLPPGGDFTSELLNDVIPFVEANYRVRGETESRAIAGLSMGGMQTTGVFAEQPDRFGYVAIWSAGLFNQPAEEFESRNADLLGSADQVNRNVSLLSIVVGEDDFARPGSEALAELFAEHGIGYEFDLTGGGHTWLNWRSYLRDLAPRLFK